MSWWKFLGATACIIGCLMSPPWAVSKEPESDRWLIDAKTETERLALIEKMFGGFSNAMWAVGERYQSTFDAIHDRNYDLARYHWEKLKDAIQLGVVRRPKRRANADALFFEGPWKSLSNALASSDASSIKIAFFEAKTGCMACHAAEKVPFMNQQPLFRRTAHFPDR